jgi:hypothetical protein
MKKRTAWILFAGLLLLSSACSTPPNPIVPTISIETAVPIGQTPTHVPSPPSTHTTTPTPTITPLLSAFAPTNATAAPPAAGQIRPANQNALVPNSVSLTLSPAQWLGGSYYRLSGPTQASVFAPGAVARVEFFTAPTGTGATPTLEFVDSNGYDGWSWYWQTPRGGSHLWAEAVYANGTRASSQVLLILTNAPPPPVTWLNYNNQTLQYFLTYPSNWTVDETGLSMPNKEVLFSPPNPAPFLAYFSISLDNRTLEQIRQSYAQHFPNIPPEWIDFARQRALRYRFNAQRFELYAPGYYGTFRFASDRATLPEVPQMLNSFRYIVPIGTVPPPPPTPPCETHTASVQVQPSLQSVQVGQQLIVRVTLLNQGCATLGVPQYTLRVHAPQGQPLFNPPVPESVTHDLVVAPGQLDNAEFVLHAAQVGLGSLQANVSFEVHTGLPGPAYQAEAYSAPVNIAVTNAGTVPPPPTPPCETHTASVQVQPSAQSVLVGQQLVVRMTLSNQGCVALGLPQYTLRIHAPQGQPLFNPPQPESVTHSLAIAPGQSDSVEFVLQGAQVGSGALQARVSFEVHIGYPGPAYWGDATSAPVNIAVTGNLNPPDAEQPASGICDLANGDVVTININAAVPYPRCMKVLGSQRLQVVNATNGPVQVQLAHFNVQLQPDQAQLFDATLGSYLALGVHWLRVTGGNGPEIWLASK